MYHYIALFCPSREERQSDDTNHLIETFQSYCMTWECLTRAECIYVYAKTPVDHGMRTYKLKENSGVVLGRLFSSSTNAHVSDISAFDPSLSVASNAQGMLRDYWGAYVAILHSSKHGEAIVTRDCSARIPCYFTYFRGVYIFFSDISDVLPAGIPLSINERYLASFIIRQPLHVRETGLCEVRELLAGDSILISSAGAEQRFLWNARTVAVTKPIASYEEARSLFLSVTEQVIRAWANVYRRILLRLSGGFDSAVVLGCLRHLGLSEQVVCVNHFHERSADDERYFARIAARQAGAIIEELPRMCDGRIFAGKLNSIPLDPKPDISKTARILEVDDTNALAEKYDCDALWTGQGGDHIFLQVRNAFAAADYLLGHWFPLHLTRHLYDSAVLSGQSVWSVYAQALRYKYSSSAPPDPFWTSGSSIVKRSVIDACSGGSTALPWRHGSPRLPPGKQVQIDLLSDLLNRHRPLQMLERPYEQHPLISQPLLELSLRVPTYHLLRGGRQRALARDVFAGRVPECILRREDKGSIDVQMRSLIRGSAPLLRDMLLNGTLVARGIIDRSALEGILLNNDTYRATQEFALFACIAAETWAQRWTSNTLAMAAA